MHQMNNVLLKITGQIEKEIRVAHHLTTVKDKKA